MNIKDLELKYTGRSFNDLTIYSIERQAFTQDRAMTDLMLGF